MSARPKPSTGPLPGACAPSKAVETLGEEKRERCFQDMAAEIEDPTGVWVFAYGSLMWRPAFEPREQVRARLMGYRRSFCFWTVSSRGSPQAPGLGLGIEPGAGSSVGVAQRLDPDLLHVQLRALWDREMSAGVYRCRWLSLYRDSGAVLRALAFVANDTHPQYAGRLSRHRRVQAIARARGKWGACRDYLAGVVSMLQTLSAPDAELERLLRCVDQTAQD